MALSNYEDEVRLSKLASGLGNSLDRPRQSPAFTDAIAEAEENVRTLRARIEALADKLCGSVPEADGRGEAGPSIGVFEMVAEHGRSINRNVGSAREALDRIERCLT